MDSGGCNASTITWLETEVGLQHGRQRKMFHVLTVKVLPDHKTTQTLKVECQWHFVQAYSSHLTSNSQQTFFSYRCGVTFVNLP